MVLFYLMIYASGLWAGLSCVARVALAGAADLGLKKWDIPKWHTHTPSRLSLLVSWELSQTTNGETSVPLLWVSPQGCSVSSQHCSQVPKANALRDQVGSCKASDLASGVLQHHFCRILVVKKFTKTNPDSSIGGIDFAS